MISALGGSYLFLLYGVTATDDAIEQKNLVLQYFTLTHVF